MQLGTAGIRATFEHQTADLSGGHVFPLPLLQCGCEILGLLDLRCSEKASVRDGLYPISSARDNDSYIACYCQEELVQQW